MYIQNYNLSASNTTQVRIGDICLFFSYDTLVCVSNAADSALYITSKKYSISTSKHINTFVRDIFGQQAAHDALRLSEHEMQRTAKRLLYMQALKAVAKRLQG